MPKPRIWDRTTAVAHIVTELSQGILPLNVILADMQPPISRYTLYDWRRENSDIANAIDEAFEVGMDRRAVRMRKTAMGKKPADGGDSTGNIKRDRLVLWLDEKLQTAWDSRYSRRLMLANDPKHPLTDTPARLSDEDLLRIAQQGKKTEQPPKP